MASVTVVGAQWGDEGKGKIVDWLCNRADVVVRFQGGHNAGHTLVVDGKVYKLALLPSGVVQGKLSVIGNGVVVDPWHLLNEIEKIEAQGVKITPDILVIADNACLILPIHPALDVAREAAASERGAKIGTTGRGIGLAVHDGYDVFPDYAEPSITPEEFDRRVALRSERIEFGSQVLFEPEIAIGYRLTDSTAVELSYVHLSNGQIFAQGKNEGLDEVGIRLVHRFGG